MDQRPGPLPPGQPRQALVAAVAAGLRHLGDGVTAVVACSGGPDSTALAYLVAEARPDLALTLVHVRHGLRDDAADAAVARQHASWLGIDHVEQVVEVVRRSHGTEAAARDARYGALREVADRVGAATILVGHTADDQAETVLLRLARGTGVDGLAAMAPVAGDLTRPLLRLRRDDIRRFVALEGLPYAEDPTNRDRVVRRVVVRHDVLPRLHEVAPDPVGAIARLADLARQDADALIEAARPLLDQVRWVGEVAFLPVRALRRTSRSLAARAVREVLARVGGGPPPAAATVERVFDAAAGRRRVSLPDGVDVSRAGQWLVLAARRPAPAAPLVVPAAGGEVAWGPAGRILRVIGPDAPGAGADGGVGDDGGVAAGADTPGASLPLTLDIGPTPWVPPSVEPSAAAAPPGAAASRLVLPVPALPDGDPPLTLRHRRAGDRIATPGGTARVVRLAADAGLPREARGRWPVVAHGERVVWYPGIAADRELLAAGRAEPARLLVLDLPPGRDGGPER